MGYSKSYRDSLRWMPAINVGKEDIPPYGLVMIAYYGDELCDPFGTILKNGLPHWKIDQVNDQMEADQNPACLFVCSENGIEAGDTGVVTRDFPALTLHTGKGDGLRPGMPCGPKAGSFSVSSKGFAFTFMGHDDGDPTVGGEFKNCKPDYSKYGGTHTCWVTNERVDPASGIWFGSAPTISLPIADSKKFMLTAAPANLGDFINISDNEDENLVFDGFPQGLDDKSAQAMIGIDPLIVRDTNDDNLIVRRGQGLFDVSFSATVYAEQSTDRGTPLLIQCKAGGAILQGMREQDIERDNYGVAFQLTKENIAFSHPVYLKKDDRIYLQNVSTKPIFLTYPQFSVTQRSQQSYRIPKTTTGDGE